MLSCLHRIGAFRPPALRTICCYEVYVIGRETQPDGPFTLFSTTMMRGPECPCATSKKILMVHCKDIWL